MVYVLAILCAVIPIGFVIFVNWHTWRTTKNTITDLRAKVKELEGYQLAAETEARAHDVANAKAKELEDDMKIAFMIISKEKSLTPETADKWLDQYMNKEFGLERIEAEAALEEDTQ